MGGPLLQCTPACTDNCQYPACNNTVVFGVAAFTQNDEDDCIEPKLATPIYPRKLDPNNPFDRERKVGAYYTDVRPWLEWINTAMEYGINSLTVFKT